MVGKRGESKHSLLVLTERKTRNELIYLLYEHTTEQVCKRLDQLEAEWGEQFGQVFKTITVDNGSEFADWKGRGLDQRLPKGDVRMENLRRTVPRRTGKTGINRVE